MTYANTENKTNVVMEKPEIQTYIGTYINLGLSELGTAVTVGPDDGEYYVEFSDTLVPDEDNTVEVHLLPQKKGSFEHIQLRVPVNVVFGNIRVSVVDQLRRK